MRYQLLHVAARLGLSGRRAKLHLPTAWPWTQALKAAFHKLKMLPPYRLNPGRRATQPEQTSRPIAAITP